MLPIRAWRIVYADGSTFDSSQGSWAEAPPFGVTCVVWYHDPPYVTVDTNADGVYWYQSEPFVGTDVKLGLWMDDDGYYRVMDLARRMVSP